MKDSDIIKTIPAPESESDAEISEEDLFVAETIQNMLEMEERRKARQVDRLVSEWASAGWAKLGKKKGKRGKRGRKEEGEGRTIRQPQDENWRRSVAALRPKMEPETEEARKAWEKFIEIERGAVDKWEGIVGRWRDARSNNPDADPMEVFSIEEIRELCDVLSSAHSERLRSAYITYVRPKEIINLPPESADKHVEFEGHLGTLPVEEARRPIDYAEFTDSKNRIETAIAQFLAKRFSKIEELAAILKKVKSDSPLPPEAEQAIREARQLAGKIKRAQGELNELCRRPITGSPKHKAEAQKKSKHLIDELIGIIVTQKIPDRAKKINRLRRSLDEAAPPTTAEDALTRGIIGPDEYSVYRINHAQEELAEMERLALSRKISADLVEEQTKNLRGILEDTIIKRRINYDSLSPSIKQLLD